MSTPKWRQLVEAEDAFYSRAVGLADEAVLRLRDAVERREMDEDKFYILSYLLSKSDLRLVTKSSVVTGRARLLGFRVGFAGQNPSLGT